MIFLYRYYMIWVQGLMCFNWWVVYTFLYGLSARIDIVTNLMVNAIGMYIPLRWLFWVMTVLSLVCIYHWRLCVGRIVSDVLCWTYCVGRIVLDVLYWTYCVGRIVLDEIDKAPIVMNFNTGNEKSERNLTLRGWWLE